MRVAILAHDKWGPASAKTGHSILRYARDGWSAQYARRNGGTGGGEGLPVATEVVAIVDRSRAGHDASDFVGETGRGVPVVRSVAEALPLGPESLAIGIAPVGGALPEDWRPDLRTALANGLRIVSGLHLFIGDDPEMAALAKEHSAAIHDVRRPPRRRRIATGEGALVDALVCLHVGTDCSSGKMTTAIELCREARRRGIRAAFVATGQTGMMVGCDSGAGIDAIVSDFVAGQVEECVVAAARGADVVFVEGQGSITHPAYSGVTCSLLHGSFPDVLVLSDEPARPSLTFPSAFAFATNPLSFEVELNERLLKPTTGGRGAAVALVTRGLTREEYLKEVGIAERETGLPAGDVFRGDAPKLLDAVLAAGEKAGVWDGRRAIPGAKRARYSGRAPGRDDD